MQYVPSITPNAACTTTTRAQGRQPANGQEGRYSGEEKHRPFVVGTCARACVRLYSVSAYVPCSALAHVQSTT